MENEQPFIDNALKEDYNFLTENCEIYDHKED